MDPAPRPSRAARGYDGIGALVLALLSLPLIGRLLDTAGSGRGPSVSVQAVFSQLGFLAGVALWVRIRSLPATDTFSLRRPGWRALLAAAVGAAALHFLLAPLFAPLMELFKALNLDYERQLKGFEEELLSEWNRAPLLLAFSVAVMPALCEEALFRGVMLAGFRNSLGTRGALVLTALLFGLVHVFPARIAVTFVLGLYFGAVVILSRSLLAGVVAHFINNVLAIGVAEDWAGRGILFVASLAVFPACLAILVRGRAPEIQGAGGPSAGLRL